MNLDRAVRDALDKHDHLLAVKAIELALGKLVSLHGVREVRRYLLWYARHLKEFDNK